MPGAPHPPTESRAERAAGLKGRTVGALKWSYFSMATGMVLQVVFAATLSRLLTTEAFGVFANAMILQRFGMFIASQGIGQALVQKPDLSDEDISAALTSSLLLGALATLVIWLLAPATGRYFGSPELVEVARGYSVTLLLLSTVVVHASLLRRALRFRPLVVAELSSYVIGHGLLGLGSAYLGYGAFSLVISAVAQALIQAVILYAAHRQPLRLTLRPGAYRHLFSFGSRATAVSFLQFLSGNLDTFMIARLFSKAALGIYSRTFNTLALPAMNFSESLTRVLAPSFSAIQDDRPRLRRVFHRGQLALSLLIFGAAGCIVVDAPEIVAVLLGPQFSGAARLMQIFALYLPLIVVPNLTAVLAEATAHLNEKVLVEAAYLLTLAGALWLTYQRGGHTEAFAATLVAVAALRALALAVVARRILRGGGRQTAAAYLQGLLAGLGAAAVTAAVVLPLRQLGLPVAALFAVQLLAGGGVVLGLVLLGPENELRDLARGALGRVWRGRRVRD